jgi:catechol 2,3-dioxygenase-like lactoylglutathione lyase family enzyme
MERTMLSDLAEKLVTDFEQGRLTRRQLTARLLGLGAAMAATSHSTGAQDSAIATAAKPTFQATGLDHIALDVTDLARSNAWYGEHLGLRVIRGDGNASFLGQDRDFFLTLFRAERPGLNHYCYRIDRYSADDAMERLAAAKLRPRREGNRVYFPDPDGITVQVAGPSA